MSNGTDPVVGASLSAGELVDTIKDQYAGLLEDLGAQREKVEALIEESEPDMIAAIEAQDWAALRTSVDTIGVGIVSAGIELRGLERERGNVFMQTLLAALLRLATSKIAAALLIALLLLAPGCAWFQRGTVPTQGPVRSSIDDVCDFLGHCADQALIPAVPGGCDTTAEGSLAAVVLEQKNIEGVMLQAQLDPICEAVSACGAAAAMPEYRRNVYGRACSRLRQVAAAAIAE